MKRSRTRSRSHLENQRLREELELEKQRLSILEKQLKTERDRRDLQEQERHRELELRVRRLSPERESVETERSELHVWRQSPQRDSIETERSRYDPTSIFFEQILKVLKNQSNERDTFPVLNNVLPEFDPLCKEQLITVWLSKVDECAEIYKWNDRQTIHYALPKLTGHAKLWYQGLPSLKRTWSEWKLLLKESFPATENYAGLLTEMLNKRVRFGESLEIYYFSKINLLNRCKIFGKEAIDCIVHGVDDRGVRVGALAANFEKPEQVLQFFKTIKVQVKDSIEYNRKDKRPSNLNTINRSTYKSNEQTNPPKSRQNFDSVTCFNCKEKGHPCSRCPKPIVKCLYCRFIGHATSDCPKKNPKPESKEKTVLRIPLDEDLKCNVPEPSTNKNNSHDLLHDNSSSKYKIAIEINGSPIICQVDLGSEATLIRKTDAQNLGLQWSTVESPLLRGLGNIPYVPVGKTLVSIDVQGVIEKDVEVLIIDDSLINHPVLLGHTFTERPSVRIIKTAIELKFEKVDQCINTKISLRTENIETIEVDEIKTIRLNTDDKISGNVYIGGSVMHGK
ncbi:Uncharacterized protein OBRU01_17788 [Operophtera brumata]|uniref:CCHC-type domain-containing protein n=1 Tax=Operophtera brumata TaxID=104452 RepID=A0A0L7KQL6_OPEBR|nr:Uncharacterized protein OBRU01_17788 [Operophtera brumata]